MEKQRGFKTFKKMLDISKLITGQSERNVAHGAKYQTLPFLKK